MARNLGKFWGRTQKIMTMDLAWYATELNDGRIYLWRKRSKNKYNNSYINTTRIANLTESIEQKIIERDQFIEYYFPVDE